MYMTSSDHRRDLCQVRDDISLIVRQFNQPLPNAMSSPMPTTPQFTPLSVIIPPSGDGNLADINSPQQRPFSPQPDFLPASSAKPATKPVYKEQNIHQQ